MAIATRYILRLVTLLVAAGLGWSDYSASPSSAAPTTVPDVCKLLTLHQIDKIMNSQVAAQSGRPVRSHGASGFPTLVDTCTWQRPNFTGPFVYAQLEELVSAADARSEFGAVRVGMNIVVPPAHHVGLGDEDVVDVDPRGSVTFVVLQERFVWVIEASTPQGVTKPSLAAKEMIAESVTRLLLARAG